MEMREKALDTMLWEAKSENNLISHRCKCMNKQYL